MSNGTFTWYNKRGGESQVASRLDRFLMSKDLMLKDKDIAARVLPFAGLDQWLVQLENQGIGTPRNIPFRFENIQLSHQDFINYIAISWVEELNIQGTRILPLQKRPKHIKLRLKEWNKKEYGNIVEAKKFVEGKMKELNQTLIMERFDKDRSDQATKYHQEWENLCKQEESFWRQKSRVQWLKEGEHTTRFFHRSTMENIAHNRISSIKDEGGNLLNSHEEKEAVLVQHFRDIAQETCSDKEQSIRVISKHIPKLVTREDTFNLNIPISEDEVSEVL